MGGTIHLVGLGWHALLVMSVQSSRVGQGGWFRSEIGLKSALKSERIRNSMLWCLTSSNEPRRPGGIGPAGLVHTLSVCLLEAEEMARGKSVEVGGKKPVGMPRFVDVLLTAEGRAQFVDWKWDHEQLVCELQRLTDSGYRVGCSWSGETQAYSVSLTCRDETSVNAGLCMTSFAKTLERAIALAVWKHTVYTEGNWLGVASATTDDFG